MKTEKIELENNSASMPLPEDATLLVATEISKLATRSNGRTNRWTLPIIAFGAAFLLTVGVTGCNATSSSNPEATPTTKAEQLVATQTSTPLIVKPTETSVPASATPKPIEAVPTISKDQIAPQLDALIKTVNTLEYLDTKVTKEAFEMKKENININVNNAKTALEKGDTETAHQDLLKAKNALINIGDPLKSVFVPQEEKQKHDPKNKYIQKDRVDPITKAPYLVVIDALVSTDPAY